MQYDLYIYIYIYISLLKVFKEIYIEIFEFYICQIVYPSKHDFFLRIARVFPFVTHLTVLGNRILNNADESSDRLTSVVEFHHLTSLTIHFYSAIYVKQFLVHTNTHLLNLMIVLFHMII